jgi:GNAT superfamily N-acetyltransferase
MSHGLEFARASLDEIATMVAWAAREGWNPGDHDAVCFRAADPAGFWVAGLHGEIAACMSLVTYNSDFAFLGFYITRPDLRGQGIGYALWQHALKTCPARTIGLDGVVNQQDNYRKSGFTLAHRNIRYGGIPSGARTIRPDIAPVEPSDMGALTALDQAHFPAPRPAFLETWLGTAGHIALLARDGAQITGYGVIRSCRQGHKIGPLFASDPETAENLFDALAAQAGGGMTFMDSPEPNSAAIELCRRRGLEPVFETARMYRGTTPDLPLRQTFGISTLELG